MLIVTFIVCVVLFHNWMGSTVHKAREAVSDQRMVLVLPLYVLATALRKLFPPLYFLFPLGTVFAMYCVDKRGVHQGALVYQAIKLQDIAYFLLIRRFYSAPVQRMFKEDAQRSGWLSVNMQNALRVLDREWSQYTHGRPLWLQSLVILAINTCLFMEDYVAMLWFATRSGVRALVYGPSFALALLCEYHKTVVKLRAYISVADAVLRKHQQQNNKAAGTADGDQSSSMWGQLGSLPWYEVVLGILLPLASTVFVHGTHAKLMWRYVQTVWRRGAQRARNFSARNFSLRNLARPVSSKRVRANEQQLPRCAGAGAVASPDSPRQGGESEAGLCSPGKVAGTGAAVQDQEQAQDHGSSEKKPLDANDLTMSGTGGARFV
eukprot:g6918.t1